MGSHLVKIDPEKMLDRPVGKAVTQKTDPSRIRSDPTEWRPRDNSDYEWVDNNLSAEEVRSEPLHYASLAGMDPAVLAGIEANSRGALVQAMDRLGITVDERAVRVHWQLVVEGYGFREPDGFIHPEAPDDVKADGHEAWKRVVQMAADSVHKYLFVNVWRRRRVALPPKPPMLSLGEEMAHALESANATEDVVDAEIVEE